MKRLKFAPPSLAGLAELALVMTAIIASLVLWQETATSALAEEIERAFKNDGQAAVMDLCGFPEKQNVVSRRGAHFRCSVSLGILYENGQSFMVDRAYIYRYPNLRQATLDSASYGSKRELVLSKTPGDAY